ncbi:TetR family transcriptional regulator, partial [Pseudomonas syringae pv. tagetis]
EGKCATMVRDQLQDKIERATARGQITPTPDALIDAVDAPMIYRIL